MEKKELDRGLARDLAGVMMLEPEDGERLREDINQIKSAIEKTAVSGDKPVGRGPVMLEDVSPNTGTRLRDDTAEQREDGIISSPGYKKPYNTVPRLI